MAVALLILIFCVSGALFYGLKNPVVQDRLKTFRELPNRSSFRTRTNAWKDSLLIWRAYPVMGAGPNAFRNVYKQHRRTSERGHMTHAENEYVQIPADTGTVGCLLFLFLCVAIVRRSKGGADLSRRSSDSPVEDGAKTGVPVDRAIRISAAGAVSAAVIHAFLEFALHVPLYAIVLGTLLGLNIHKEKHADSSARLPWHILPGLAVVLFLAPLTASMERGDSNHYVKKSNAREVARHLVWSPTSWQHWYYLGRHAAHDPSLEARHFAAYCLTQASVYDQYNYVLLNELGKFRLNAGDRKGAQEAFDRVKKLRAWVPVPNISRD